MGMLIHKKKVNGNDTDVERSCSEDTSARATRSSDFLSPYQHLSIP